MDATIIFRNKDNSIRKCTVLNDHVVLCDMPGFFQGSTIIDFMAGDSKLIPQPDVAEVMSKQALLTLDSGIAKDTIRLCKTLLSESFDQGLNASWRTGSRESRIKMVIDVTKNLTELMIALKDDQTNAAGGASEVLDYVGGKEAVEVGTALQLLIERAEKEFAREKEQNQQVRTERSMMEREDIRYTLMELKEWRCMQSSQCLYTQG